MRFAEYSSCCRSCQQLVSPRVSSVEILEPQVVHMCKQNELMIDRGVVNLFGISSNDHLMLDGQAYNGLRSLLACEVHTLKRESASGNGRSQVFCCFCAGGF